MTGGCFFERNYILHFVIDFSGAKLHENSVISKYARNEKRFFTEGR
jgi:hypothetical protein